MESTPNPRICNPAGEYFSGVEEKLKGYHGHQQRPTGFFTATMPDEGVPERRLLRHSQERARSGKFNTEAPKYENPAHPRTTTRIWLRKHRAAKAELAHQIHHLKIKTEDREEHLRLLDIQEAEFEGAGEEDEGDESDSQFVDLTTPERQISRLLPDRSLNAIEESTSAPSSQDTRARIHREAKVNSAVSSIEAEEDLEAINSVEDEDHTEDEEQIQAQILGIPSTAAVGPSVQQPVAPTPIATAPPILPGATAPPPAPVSSQTRTVTRIIPPTKRTRIPDGVELSSNKRRCATAPRPVANRPALQTSQSSPSKNRAAAINPAQAQSQPILGSRPEVEPAPVIETAAIPIALAPKKTPNPRKRAAKKNAAQTSRDEEQGFVDIDDIIDDTAEIEERARAEANRSPSRLEVVRAETIMPSSPPVSVRAAVSEVQPAKKLTRKEKSASYKAAAKAKAAKAAADPPRNIEHASTELPESPFPPDFVQRPAAPPTAGSAQKSSHTTGFTPVNANPQPAAIAAVNKTLATPQPVVATPAAPTPSTDGILQPLSSSAANARKFPVPMFKPASQSRAEASAAPSPSTNIQQTETAAQRALRREAERRNPRERAQEQRLAQLRREEDEKTAKKAEDATKRQRAERARQDLIGRSASAVAPDLGLRSGISKEVQRMQRNEVRVPFSYGAPAPVPVVASLATSSRKMKEASPNTFYYEVREKKAAEVARLAAEEAERNPKTLWKPLPEISPSSPTKARPQISSSPERENAIHDEMLKAIDSLPTPEASQTSSEPQAEITSSTEKAPAEQLVQAPSPTIEASQTAQAPSAPATSTATNSAAISSTPSATSSEAQQTQSISVPAVAPPPHWVRDSASQFINMIGDQSHLEQLKHLIEQRIAANGLPSSQR